jgi:GT2 family glycosyltransferase
MSVLGVVAIGRNEGERLRQCLESVVGRGRMVVYVDSGSTDGSQALARSLGAEVVELDTTVPFTAARARNTGLERLLAIAPETRFVQFVDGDCEIVAGWLETAQSTLEARPELAVVCGRRRERYPERSIYNRLADLEWDTPIGDTTSCGGDALMRVEALRCVGGFNPAIIAGEEPELCVRLRQDGWKIARIDAEMTRHDMAMTHFRQWWRRSVRNGHAYAEGAARHGRSPQRHWVHQARSNWFWGLVLPALAFGLAWPSGGASLGLLAAYPASWVRNVRRARARGWSPSDARLYASACVVGKFPQVLGQLQYVAQRLLGRPPTLIEYKGAPLPAPRPISEGVVS